MKKDKNFIKTKFKKFLNENIEKEKKYFEITDKTGRSMKPYIFDKKHIEKNFDLTEEDWDNEETLGEFLNNCYIDDTWNTRTLKIKCTEIK